MDLHQAGVRFKLGSSKKLPDIKFDADKGALVIPCLKIEDDTETLFRNVQAFEQCHFGSGFIGNYITMINLVVHASKDLEILARKGIIENWLRDNDTSLNTPSSMVNIRNPCPLEKDPIPFLNTIKHRECKDHLHISSSISTSQLSTR